jgi:hypothetical protein
MSAVTAPSRPAEQAVDPRHRDAQLMARVAAGDDGAFASLHREHYPAVFRLAGAVMAGLASELAADLRMQDGRLHLYCR